MRHYVGEKQGKHISLPRSGSYAICLFLVCWKKAHQLGTSLPPKQTLQLVRPSFAGVNLMKALFVQAWMEAVVIGR